jgi:hypothetical protein
VTFDGIALGADVTDLDARVFDVGLYANDDGDVFVNSRGADVGRRGDRMVRCGAGQSGEIPRRRYTRTRKEFAVTLYNIATDRSIYNIATDPSIFSSTMLWIAFSVAIGLYAGNYRNRNQAGWTLLALLI